jgi:hypothetical protein
MKRSDMHGVLIYVCSTGGVFACLAGCLSPGPFRPAICVTRGCFGPNTCCQDRFALLSALRGVVRACYLAYEGLFRPVANIYLRYEGFLAYVALIAGCWNSAVLTPPSLGVSLFWRLQQPLVSEIDVCNRPKPPLVTQIGMLEAWRALGVTHPSLRGCRECRNGGTTGVERPETTESRTTTDSHPTTYRPQRRFNIPGSMETALIFGTIANLVPNLCRFHLEPSHHGPCNQQ